MLCYAISFHFFVICMYIKTQFNKMYMYFCSRCLRVDLQHAWNMMEDVYCTHGARRKLYEWARCAFVYCKVNLFIYFIFLEFRRYTWRQQNHFCARNFYLFWFFWSFLLGSFLFFISITFYYGYGYDRDFI